MKTIKYSKQRELIYKTVAATKVHPTADYIYSKLKKEHPALSLGTVYRNLSRLAEAGKIIKLNMADGPDRFDGDLIPHYHIVCEGCGEVTDLFINYMEDIDRMVEERTGIKINSHTLTFKTLCSKCRK